MPRKRPWRLCAIAGLVALSAGILHAQDPFEIHVLEYEELKPGQFTLENHTNYVGESGFAAGNDILHMTYELTAGVTDQFSLGVMQLNARRPGGPLESAGWRLVPHFYAPHSWHWPIDAGLTVEMSFQSTKWTTDSKSIELIPILEKRLGRLQFDLNPSFERALHGPGVRAGWGFGLAARMGYSATRRFTPSLEYYSDWGSVLHFAPVGRQVHQILPGGDIHLTKSLLWSTGIGIGATGAGNRVVYKSRLEFSFGGKGKS
jgi:hypothetical protein